MIVDPYRVIMFLSFIKLQVGQGQTTSIDVFQMGKSILNLNAQEIQLQ